MGYTKLFDKLVRSSIWDENDQTRIVWITLLALADRNGVVIATENYLRMAARVELEELRNALVVLLSPDPKSTSSDHAGRRIQEVEGGWLLLNHGKYRQMMRQEERQEYQRAWQARKRDKMKSKPLPGEKAYVKSVENGWDEPPSQAGE